MNFAVDIVEELFPGPPDDCERLVGALQYCAFIPSKNTFSNAVIVTLLEKGVLYRGMIDLADLSVLDQCFYVHNKFTEYHERLMMVDVEVVVAKQRLEDVILPTISRVKSNFEYQAQRMPLLKVFQVVKINNVVLIFDNDSNRTQSSLSRCKVILISNAVHIVDMDWTEVLDLVHEISALLHSTDPSKSSLHAPHFSASIISVIREKDAADDGDVSAPHFSVEEDHGYDDQVIAFHDYLHACKKEEAAGSIVELRESIKGIYQTLQDQQQQQTRRPLDLPPRPFSQNPSQQSRPSTGTNSLGSQSLTRRYEESRPGTRDEDTPPPPPLGESFATLSLRENHSLPPPSHNQPANDNSSGSNRQLHTDNAMQSLLGETPPPLAPSLASDEAHALHRPSNKDFALLPGARYDSSEVHPANMPHSDLSDWGSNSQTTTIFHHQRWQRQDAQEEEDVPCNQSLSDLSSVSSALASSSAHLHGQRPQQLPPATSYLDHIAEDDAEERDQSMHHTAETAIPARTLDDILRETAADYDPDAEGQNASDDLDALHDNAFHSPSRQPYLDRLTTAQPSDYASQSIHSPHTRSPTFVLHRNDEPEKATITTSPTKPLSFYPPANHHLSSQHSTDSSQQQTGGVSESLRRDLLASNASEDFLGYAKRAYMAMRDRAVEDSEYTDLSLTQSTLHVPLQQHQQEQLAQLAEQKRNDEALLERVSERSDPAISVLPLHQRPRTAQAHNDAEDQPRQHSHRPSTAYHRKPLYTDDDRGHAEEDQKVRDQLEEFRAEKAFRDNVRALLQEEEQQQEALERDAESTAPGSTPPRHPSALSTPTTTPSQPAAPSLLTPAATRDATDVDLSHRSLTSVRSANHSNFDDFFAGIEDPQAAKVNTDGNGTSPLASDDEVEDMDAVVVRNDRGLEDQEHNAQLLEPPTSAAMDMMDDLMNELDIHTPLEGSQEHLATSIRHPGDHLATGYGSNTNRNSTSTLVDSRAVTIARHTAPLSYQSRVDHKHANDEDKSSEIDTDSRNHTGQTDSLKHLSRSQNNAERGHNNRPGSAARSPAEAKRGSRYEADDVKGNKGSSPPSLRHQQHHQSEQLAGRWTVQHAEDKFVTNRSEDKEIADERMQNEAVSRPTSSSSSSAVTTTRLEHKADGVLPSSATDATASTEPNPAMQAKLRTFLDRISATASMIEYEAKKTRRQKEHRRLRLGKQIFEILQQESLRETEELERQERQAIFGSHLNQPRPSSQLSSAHHSRSGSPQRSPNHPLPFSKPVVRPDEYTSVAAALGQPYHRQTTQLVQLPPELDDSSARQSDPLQTAAQPVRRTLHFTAPETSSAALPTAVEVPVSQPPSQQQQSKQAESKAITSSQLSSVSAVAASGVATTQKYSSMQKYSMPATVAPNSSMPMPAQTSTSSVEPDRKPHASTLAPSTVLDQHQSIAQPVHKPATTSSDTSSRNQRQEEPSQHVQQQPVHQKPAPVAWEVDLQTDDGSITSASQRPRSQRIPRALSNGRGSRLPQPVASSAHVAAPHQPESSTESPQKMQSLSKAHVAPSTEIVSLQSPPSQAPPQPSSRPRSQSAGIRRPVTGHAQSGSVSAAASSAAGAGGTNSNSGSGSSSKLSNYAQTKNAVSYVCLAGGHQEEKRFEVLEMLDYYAAAVSSRGGGDRSTAPIFGPDVVVIEELRGKIAQFVLMFYKAKTLAFKGIYVLDARTRYLVRVFGKGPSRLNSDGDGLEGLVKEYLKFETSSKSLKTLPVKSLTSTVDGIILEPPRASGSSGPSVVSAGGGSSRPVAVGPSAP